MSNPESVLLRPIGFEINPISGVKPEERTSLVQPGLGALSESAWDVCWEWI